MNADVLSTKVTEGIAVITLGSAKRMYFDAEMGDALTGTAPPGGAPASGAPESARKGRTKRSTCSGVPTR